VHLHYLAVWHQDGLRARTHAHVDSSQTYWIARGALRTGWVNLPSVRTLSSRNVNIWPLSRSSVLAVWSYWEKSRQIWELHGLGTSAAVPLTEREREHCCFLPVMFVCSTAKKPRIETVLLPETSTLPVNSNSVSTYNSRPSSDLQTRRFPLRLNPQEREILTKYYLLRIVVKALCYKPEGRGFDTRWGDFFSIYLILPAALGPQVYSASNRNEYQKHKNNNISEE
jgi:hypothetical protein